MDRDELGGVGVDIADVHSLSVVYAHPVADIVRVRERHKNYSSNEVLINVA